MKGLFFVLLIAILMGTMEVRAVEWVVKTLDGNISGTLSPSGTHKLWYIPYAAPPTGTNRWKPPQSVIPWNGVLNGTFPPPVCPQTGGLAERHSPGGISEDCLYLSVYVPLNHTTNNTQLPIQIFIHGGSFVDGGLIFYSGELLSGTNVIFVAINYRLGPLGYLAHGALANDPERSPGLGWYGIQDQRAAFQWVQDNIEFFGGNSSRVTISGESAGAISLCAHIVAPESAGLFHQVISESGYCAAFASNETGYNTGQQFVSNLNCENGTDEEVLECLLNADVTNILAAASSFSPYNPSLSSEVTVLPVDLLESGIGVRVPLLIGTNLNEASLFVCPNPSQANLTAQEYATLLVETFHSYSKAVLQVYPVSDFSTPTEAYINVFSDFTFKCGTKLLAELFSQNPEAPTYMYSFNHDISLFQIPWVTKALFQASPSCLGVAHSYELAILFTLFETLVNIQLTPEEVQFRTVMRDAWASFVINGVPSLPNLEWPQFNTTTQTYVNLDLNITLGDQFRAPYCVLWGI